MNYELAKELKDSGFNQKNKEYYFMIDGSIISRHDENFWSDLSYECANPTIEELIEACGERVVYHNFDIDWVAGVATQAARKEYKEKGYLMMDLEHEYHGSTAVEAVARLWLALNKKEEFDKSKLSANISIKGKIINTGTISVDGKEL